MLCELKKLCSVHLYSDIIYYDTLDRHNNSLTIRLHMNLVFPKANKRKYTTMKWIEPPCNIVGKTCIHVLNV